MSIGTLFPLKSFRWFCEQSVHWTYIRLKMISWLVISDMKSHEHISECYVGCQDFDNLNLYLFITQSYWMALDDWFEWTAFIILLWCNLAKERPVYCLRRKIMEERKSYRMTWKWINDDRTWILRSNIILEGTVYGLQDRKLEAVMKKNGTHVTAC